jgi:lipid-A-disaccharide synthase-like uncharacterized protein
MNYFVKRGEQQYGPYSLAALQQYVAQGNISQQDFARSEAMADWVPVSTILGNVPVPIASTFATSSDAITANLTPPPNLHWAIVLALGIVTFGIFFIIWLFVQAAWIRKVVPESKAIFFLLGYLVMIIGAVGFQGSVVGAFVQLGGLVVYIMGIFKMRSDIEDYYASLNPVGLSLNGAMTFFFNTIYFQYHFPEIRETAQNLRTAAATAGH